MHQTPYQDRGAFSTSICFQTQGSGEAYFDFIQICLITFSEFADSKVSLALFASCLIFRIHQEVRLQAGYVKLQRDQYLEKLLRVTPSKSLQWGPLLIARTPVKTTPGVWVTITTFRIKLAKLPDQGNKTWLFCDRWTEVLYETRRYDVFCLFKMLKTKLFTLYCKSHLL